MKARNLIAAALFAALGSLQTARAEGAPTWTFTYNASTKTATLTKVTAAEGEEIPAELSLPSSVNGYTVTAVGNNSFQGLAITSLTIPNTVTTIGYGAFANCTALKSVVLGSGLETIANGATGWSRNGANTNDPDSYAGYGAFGNCINLETVEFGENVRMIGAHAFSECESLKALNLPDSVKTIGENAFYHNSSLASVSFGVGLEQIGQNAFYNCPELQSVAFRESNTPLLAIGDSAFARAVKLTGLTFSESLKTLGQYAFAGCTSLQALTLPDSLTAISAGAFVDCTALKSVVLGSGLETIANGATGWSRNGANTNDPDSYAGYGAFGNCINLETVEFGENVRMIGAHAFSECESLKALNLPDSLTTIGANAFYQNKRLSRITFGEKIELIGYNAFMGCEMLTLVEFSAVPAPSVIIRENAFRNCVTLATLMLPNAILTLESNSFAGCRSLRKITVPSIISELSSGLLSPEKMPFLNEVTFAGLPPENIENAGLRAGIKIRYSSEYAEEWADAIETCGFTNATAYDPSEAATVIGGDSRYELSHEQSDRSIASITINADTAIDAFILTDGKVYDSVLRIVNTADGAVTLTLPAGYTYETFEGADPLTIPANSRNLLTITRTEENVFLVSREKLKVIQ